eukprot:14878190-Heterocapsa_arctica.AAC.1
MQVPRRTPWHNGATVSGPRGFNSSSPGVALHSVASALTQQHPWAAVTLSASRYGSAPSTGSRSNPARDSPSTTA